jgi:hypothetical protein
MDSWKSLDNMFFGPLDSSYCIIFYVFMVIFFLSLVVIVGKTVYDGVFSSKNMTTRDMLPMLLSILYAVLLYLHQRLLYSMCVKSNL